jgi:hypothetical protein
MDGTFRWRLHGLSAFSLDQAALSPVDALHSNIATKSKISHKRNATKAVCSSLAVFQGCSIRAITDDVIGVAGLNRHKTNRFHWCPLPIVYAQHTDGGRSAMTTKLLTVAGNFLQTVR